MKKQMLLGVALSSFLSLSGAVYANSVRNTADTVALNKSEQPGSPTNPEKPDRGQLPGSSLNRLVSESAHELGARWSWVDLTGKTEVMAFTSTAAANTAATLMNDRGGALSFASFGRVPFYQLLTLTNPVVTNSPNQSSARPSASIPEPTTLTLLGAGLAALAAGLRKKNKRK